MNIAKFALAPLALFALAGCGSNTETPVATAPQSVAAATPATGSAPDANKALLGTKPTPNMTPLNAPGVQTKAKQYRVRGLVSGVEKSGADGRMTLIVKHEDIPDFMPSMEMRMPFALNADAEKVKAGDKIAFDLNADNIEVTNVEKLPPTTTLKLKK